MVAANEKRLPNLVLAFGVINVMTLSIIHMCIFEHILKIYMIEV